MISIVIPAINEEKLLGRMLQQFAPDVVRRFDLELVVSDGGSTDRTLEISHRYAHKVIENTSGIKQTIALGRNIGARHADGDILVFLNADTLIEEVPFFFERLLEEIHKPRIVALTCSVEVYPFDQRWIDRTFHGFYNWFFWRMNMIGMGMGRGECHIMRREVFDAVNGYTPHIAAGEDYDLFSRLRKRGEIRFLKDVVVYESPRRYRKYGYAYVTVSWFLNFLSIFFLRRSLLSEWKPVR